MTRLLFLIAFIMVLPAPEVVAQNCPALCYQWPQGDCARCLRGEGTMNCTGSAYGGMQCQFIPRQQQQRVPQGGVNCGGYYCNAGQQCSKNRKGCQPAGKVDCGDYWCDPGMQCAKNSRMCLAEGQVECGFGFCSRGYRCAANNSCQRILAATTDRNFPGIAIDKISAQRALPYARLASAAYDNRSIGASAHGWKMIADWETTLRVAGYSDRDIRVVRATGFYAAVYKNEQTRETVIAFRGTTFTSYMDWVSNFSARTGAIDLQYSTATHLVRAVKSWASGEVTVTGHSLGAGLATYSGATNGIRNVYTFNSARAPLFVGGNNPSQVNIVVPGDIVGDPARSGLFAKIAGIKALPGTLYQVQSTENDLHGIKGIIGGLEDAAQ